MKVIDLSKPIRFNRGDPRFMQVRIRHKPRWTAKLLVRVDHIALPNLVAGRRIVPELVQGACTPQAIAASLSGFLDDPEKAEALRSGLSLSLIHISEPTRPY